MASKAAQKRLSKEYMNMQKSPPPFVWAAPDEKNILTWNFLLVRTLSSVFPAQH
ncbi:Ubiquitin-conjugating enzyme E2 6 [Tulasnella sp. 418]|nr:Ubiquitin-conjugating enzyme E2 6 [Tulasnella sp. 418]